MKALTPPTPEKVADMLTDVDGTYHDGNEWNLGVSRVGNVVRIGIEPFADDDEGTRLPKVHFRAVVVEGETVPDLAEAGRLKTRLEAAEWTMRQALAQVEHEEVVHLVNRYFAAAEAAQAQKGGTP